MGGQERADTSNLLIPGRVLLLLPRLVPLVGLNEAIVLQQVRFLTAPDRAPADEAGRRWVCLSYASWQERHFPFWGCDTIKRAFRTLEAEGFLLSERPQRAARDQTKAYAIDYRRLDELERALRAAAVGIAVGRASSRRKRVTTGEADAAALPASNLLIDDHPLVIIPRLAALVGLDEAIVLQQVRYWLADARNPRIYDGRRWVRFTHQEWAAQIPRSPRTLGTIFRQLEARGLLSATTALNAVRGDQTRWYTIDFDALAALEPGDSIPESRPRPSMVATPDGNSAPIETAILPTTLAPDPEGKDAPIEMATLHPANGKDARIESAKLHRVVGKSAPAGAASLPGCLMEMETDHNTFYETQQHGQAQVGDVVVARNNTVVEGRNESGEDTAEDALGLLTRRGITGTAARELAAQWPERISMQIEIYDWLREDNPRDERYTPGRLRRMIEEDWAAPAGFVPADERALQERARAAAERRALEDRARREAERDARNAIAAATRQEALARLGLAEADQADWARLLNGLPRLAPVLVDALRRAFFHAPVGGNPAAVILSGAEDKVAVLAERHAGARAGIERGVAERYRRPGAKVLFLHYEEVVALLAAEGGP